MSAELTVYAEPILPVISEETLSDDARDFILSSKAGSTIRAYKSDGVIFERWCQDRNRDAIPATPKLLVEFLTSEAKAGKKAATLGRRLAAISYTHQLAEQPDPTKHVMVKAAMAGIRRTITTAQARKAPVTNHVLSGMLQHIPDTLAGKRDRALLTLGFAGAFRRSELVALTVADLADDRDGLRIRIRRSKTDQTGEGQEIAVPHGHHIRPVEAIRAWIEATGITEGPLLRQVSRYGYASRDPLTAQSVALIVKRYAKLANVRVSDFSGHSLRAGFVTSAAEMNVSESRIMDVTRHRDSRSVRGYVRRASLFRDHAGAAFL